MKPTTEISTKPSEPVAVDVFLQQLKHPKLAIIKALRKLILDAHKEIGEEIKWNAPAFFFTGKMKAFDPKEYRRHVIVMNFHKKDAVRLVFPSGARIEDKSGLLEGDYKDGRRLTSFSSMGELKTQEKDLRACIIKWVNTLEK